MTISVKHTFQSAIADDGDTSLVQPSNWNAEHTYTMATNRLVGRTTAGAGAFEEISVGTSLSLAAGVLSVSGLVIGTNVQAWDADLDSWAAITRATGFDTFVATPSGANLASLLTTALPASKGGTGLTALAANVVSLLGAADYAAMRTQLGLVIGTNVQAWDADLDSWAAVTRASGFDTFVATPSSANLRSLITDETGTGVAVFGTSPTISTKLTLTGATETTSNPVLDATQTWNGAGVVFTGIKLNVTNTASSTASRLIDLSIGGSYRFYVDTFGQGFFLDAVNTSQQLIVPAGSSGYLRANTGSGANIFPGDDGGITNYTSAIRNGTNACQLRIYATFTNSTNYERLALKTTAGSYVELAAETAGTGGDNLDVLFTPAGTGLVRFGTHSAIAAETVTGYITIKDAGGTSRKIAVVS